MTTFLLRLTRAVVLDGCTLLGRAIGEVLAGIDESKRRAGLR